MGVGASRKRPAGIGDPRRIAQPAVSLPVVTTPEAEAQIRTIDDWWRENRRASPNLFIDELLHAFDTLAQAPLLGRPYRRSSVPGVRRLLLPATRHHVYYVPNDHDVIILAVWHAERGAGPSLTR
jgi:plasmid stabilization system protein ParE